MNEIVEEGSYRYAFEILMRAIYKNDINFGSDQFFAVNAVNMVRQACTNADIGNYMSFGQWISVNDRLPRVGEYVISYGDNGPKGCCMAFVGSDDEFICEINGYYVEAYGITHWMPLPEAPKE